MSFIAGPFTITLGGSAIGIVEDAPSLEITPSVDTIRGDDMGDSVRDGVYRGGNCFVDMVLQEYNAAAAATALWPYAAEGVMGDVGDLLTDHDAALVFTKIAGTSALPATTRTFTSAILAPNFPVRYLMGSRLRNVPIRFQCLPYDDSGTTRWFKDV